jgi:hypothetical protein
MDSAKTSTNSKAIAQPVGTSAPFPYNSTAWSKLSELSGETTPVEALLLEYEPEGKEEKLAWGFLINPQSLDFENTANYGTVAPHATTVQSSQYSSTTGQTLTTPGMRFALWCYKKSAKVLLDGLKKLLEADPLNNKFSPPLLRFSWGSYNLGPLVLVKYSYKVTAVSNGEPTTVTDLTLTFKEQPRPLTKAEQEKRSQDRLKQQQESAKARGETASPTLALTERQQQDALTIAEKYLKDNISQWSADIQTLIKSDKDFKKKLTVDAKTGVVTLSDKDGKKLGTVLIYDGTKAVAGTKCTIPVKQGGKAPDISEAKKADKITEM